MARQSAAWAPLCHSRRSSFYMFTTYFATYLQVAGGLSRATALLVSLIALLFAAAICPLAGLYS